MVIQVYPILLDRNRVVLAYEIYPGVIAAPAEAQRTVASIRNWLSKNVSGECEGTVNNVSTGFNQENPIESY